MYKVGDIVEFTDKSKNFGKKAEVVKVRSDVVLLQCIDWLLLSDKDTYEKAVICDLPSDLIRLFKPTNIIPFRPKRS
jgi:hypothetical protein